MDKVESWTRMKHCRVEIEKYQTNHQSFIKEEIMIPDEIEYIDNETSSDADQCFQTGQIPFKKLDKNDTKFDEEIHVVNIDEKKEKLLVKAHINENMLGNNESNHTEKDHFHPLLSEKENVSSKKESKQSQKQTTVVNFCQNISKANKENKFNAAIRVCTKCNRKEKVLNLTQRINCQDCKEPMIFQCLTCGERLITKFAIYYHIKKDCARQGSYQCEQCNYHGKSKYLLHYHALRMHGFKEECPKCGKKLSKKNMLRHKESCGMRFLKCKFCAFNTNHKDNMEHHMQKMHKNIKQQQYNGIIKNIIEEGEEMKANFLRSTTVKEENARRRTIEKFKAVIRVCNKCTRKERVFNVTRNIYCPDCVEPMIFQCIKCSKQMVTRYAIYYHFRKDCGQPGACQCEHCSYRGKNEYLLHCHIERQHGFKEECPKCGKKLTKKSMSRHKEGCGVNVQFLRCIFCMFNTKHKENMENHLRKVHKIIKRQQYDNILKNIMEEGEKIKVNALHSNSITEENMKSKTNDYKKFIRLYCSICDKIYECVNHKKERDCEKCGTAMLLQCVKCGKRCTNMSSMYMHIHRTCAASNNFQCAHCDYATSRKKALEVHISRIHNFVAPVDYVKCSECNARYKIQLDLIQHKRRCHRMKAVTALPQEEQGQDPLKIVHAEPHTTDRSRQRGQPRTNQ